MSSKPQKIKTFNIKKCKRLEAKKRKLEAFLELVKKDEETSIEKKQTGETFKKNYNDLKKELGKYKKKEASEPSFYLIDDGVKAKVNFPLNNIYPKCSSPLFVEDVYHLLLKSVLANLSPFPVRWAKLEMPRNIPSTILYVIEGLSVENIIEMHNSLAQSDGIFPYIVEIISSDMPFATELSTLHLAGEFYSYAKENYSDLFPVDASEIEKPVEPIKTGTLSKLHLLLNPIQLVMEHYPMPVSVFEQSNCKNYVFSKDSYSPVTASSPMFALDCEMCRTISGKQEVTRIAVVDESLKTVYQTLVKPNEKIIDYITKFSGVTEEMMKDVKTTLSDVYKDLKDILPSDAILCGQSLNCDLHALKMIHPYVIDTSVIFNQFGNRQKKTSLKQLTKIYLKETIQDDKKGHNPIEDAIATMKLVQLKLRNSLKYGDAVLSPEINVSNSPENADSQLKDGSEKPNFSDFVKLNTNSKDDGFFSTLSFFSKKVCLIGKEDCLKNYRIPDSYVSQITSSNLSEIVLATSENSKCYDLVISHLPVDDSSSITELNNRIKETYDNIMKKTLFLIVISGIDKFKCSNFKRSLCMIVLKK